MNNMLIDFIPTTRSLRASAVRTVQEFLGTDHARSLALGWLAKKAK